MDSVVAQLRMVIVVEVKKEYMIAVGVFKLLCATQPRVRRGDLD